MLRKYLDYLHSYKDFLFSILPVKLSKIQKYIALEGYKMFI